MEPISTTPAQYKTGDGNEADEIMASCLRNSVVVMKILEGFSNHQLLKLSFVNKFWNNEARSVLRKRGNIIASLDRIGLCHDFQAFAVNLHSMRTVPFSGIRIVFPDKDEPCECKMSALILTDDAVVFDPLPFKSLSVQLARRRCGPGFLLAKKILQDLSEVIEELTLQIPFAAETFLKDYVQECKFPCLRILKLKETHRWEVTCQYYVSYVRVLISRAPNLKELHSDMPIRELLDLVYGSSIVPVCSYQVSAPFAEISDDVINSSALRLQRMGLVCTGGHKFDIDRFNRIFPMLLESPSTTTLCDLTVDAVLAVPLIRSGIRLESVRKLTMGISYRELKLREHHHCILRILNCFDFTRIFPNLTKVHITKKGVPMPLPLGLKTFISEQANVSESMPDRAVNIKELQSRDRVLNSHSAQFFSEMFPNIDRLHVESFGGKDAFTFGLICDHWVHLKEIHIKSTFLQDTANFDCVFCGIFFDELVQLTQMDEEYLKRVNIVPVRPSITCLRNLRVLSLNYDLNRRPQPVIYDATNPTFFLSKITGLIALNRCPNLAVTIKISPDGAHAVSHLKPYLSTVHQD